MEEPTNIIIEETSVVLENNPEPKNDKKMSTPQAIVLAGVLIMVAILITRSPLSIDQSKKTLSEQVGVSKAKLDECIKNTNTNEVMSKISESIKNAMSALPENQRGTPYSIIIGKDGVKTEVQGAESYDVVKKMVDEALAGKATKEYKGKVVLSEDTDHIQGNPNATVTIIEYSDFECPFCKRFQPTMEKIMKDYNGQVRWIYREFPLHQHSVEKLVAANCVATIKGDDAYFKYANLLFGLLKTGDESIADQL